MKKILLVLLGLLALTACSTELVHDDHDHDGVQDHAPEDNDGHEEHEMHDEEREEEAEDHPHPHK